MGINSALLMIADPLNIAGLLLSYRTTTVGSDTSSSQPLWIILGVQVMHIRIR
jgi:hypothetical protein